MMSACWMFPKRLVFVGIVGNKYRVEMSIYVHMFPYIFHVILLIIIYCLCFLFVSSMVFPDLLWTEDGLRRPGGTSENIPGPIALS